MPAGTRTYGSGETFIETKVLPPPPTRHALLAFLVALSAILHIGTVGWSDIQNGAEGYYASTARGMFRADTWIVQEPPLSYWLTVASYKCVGVTPMAARLPVAAAMVAAVAFTFLIGERLGGYWRGFVAGLIHLCSFGSFVWMRMVTPEPLFAACLGAVIFCAICGYQRQESRRFWLAWVWVCAAFAFLAKGAEGVLLPAFVFLLLAIFFREARMRFRLLLRWPNILIFLAIVLPWLVWMRILDPTFPSHFVSSEWLRPFGRNQSVGNGVPLFWFLTAHLAWWFPAAFLVLPGLGFGWRKAFRPHEFDFADALPLAWMAVGFAPLLFISQRQHFDSINIWSAFALFAAAAWDRTQPALRLGGLGLVALAGATVFSGAALNATAGLPALPAAWLGVRSVCLLAGLSIVLFTLIAAHFSWRHRETLAIAVVLLGMVPIGVSTTEGLARFGSYLSLADAARFLEPRLGDEGEVLFEGSAAAGSSLEFYLPRNPLFFEPIGGQEAIVQKLSAAHPVYLIIPKGRVPYWQERLTEQFHLYHQETTCGDHVVVSNQP